MHVVVNSSQIHKRVHLGNAEPRSTQELSRTTLNDCKVFQTAAGKLSTDAVEPKQVLGQRFGRGAKGDEEEDGDYEAEVRAALKMKEATVAFSKAATKECKFERKAASTKQVRDIVRLSSRKAQHNENCVHVQELMRQQQMDAEAATRAHLEASVTRLHQQLELVLTGSDVGSLGSAQWLLATGLVVCSLDGHSRSRRSMKSCAVKVWAFSRAYSRASCVSDESFPSQSARPVPR